MSLNLRVYPAKYIEPVPFRNIIINGDMSQAQRGTSTASITTSGYYTVDRFNLGITLKGFPTEKQKLSSKKKRKRKYGMVLIY